MALLGYCDEMMAFALKIGFLKIVKDGVRYLLLEDALGYYGEVERRYAEQEGANYFVVEYDVWGSFLLRFEVSLEKEQPFIWRIARLLHLRIYPKANLKIRIKEKGVDDEKRRPENLFWEDDVPFSGGMKIRCDALGRVSLSKDQTVRIFSRLNSLRETYERWRYLD